MYELMTNSIVNETPWTSTLLLTCQNPATTVIITTTDVESGSATKCVLMANNPFWCNNIAKKPKSFWVIILICYMLHRRPESLHEPY